MPLTLLVLQSQLWTFSHLNSNYTGKFLLILESQILLTGPTHSVKSKTETNFSAIPEHLRAPNPTHMLVEPQPCI